MWQRRSYPRFNSKFNNVPTRHNGTSYDSRLEARYAAHLDILKRGGEIQDWTLKRTFRLDVNGKHVCKFTPDFFVIGKHGREEIHETKGIATRDFMIRWKLMQALYPEYHYKLVKAKDF